MRGIAPTRDERRFLQQTLGRGGLTEEMSEQILQRRAERVGPDKPTLSASTPLPASELGHGQLLRLPRLGAAAAVRPAADHVCLSATAPTPLKRNLSPRTSPAFGGLGSPRALAGGTVLPAIPKRARESLPPETDAGDDFPDRGPASTAHKAAQRAEQLFEDTFRPRLRHQGHADLSGKATFGKGLQEIQQSSSFFSNVYQILDLIGVEHDGRPPNAPDDDTLWQQAQRRNLPRSLRKCAPAPGDKCRHRNLLTSAYALVVCLLGVVGGGASTFLLEGQKKVAWVKKVARVAARWSRADALQSSFEQSLMQTHDCDAGFNADATDTSALLGAEGENRTGDEWRQIRAALEAKDAQIAQLQEQLNAANERARMAAEQTTQEEACKFAFDCLQYQSICVGNFAAHTDTLMRQWYDGASEALLGGLSTLTPLPPPPPDRIPPAAVPAGMAEFTAFPRATHSVLSALWENFVQLRLTRPVPPPSYAPPQAFLDVAAKAVVSLALDPKPRRGDPSSPKVMLASPRGAVLVARELEELRKRQSRRITLAPHVTLIDRASGTATVLSKTGVPHQRTAAAVQSQLATTHASDASAREEAEDRHAGGGAHSLDDDGFTLDGAAGIAVSQSSASVKAAAAGWGAQLRGQHDAAQTSSSAPRSRPSATEGTHSDLAGHGGTHTDLTGHGGTHTDLTGHGGTHSDLTGHGGTHSDLTGHDGTHSDVAGGTHTDPAKTSVTGVAPPDDTSSEDAGDECAWSVAYNNHHAFTQQGADGGSSSAGGSAERREDQQRADPVLPEHSISRITPPSTPPLTPAPRALATPLAPASGHPEPTQEEPVALLIQAASPLQGPQHGQISSFPTRKDSQGENMRRPSALKTDKRVTEMLDRASAHHQKWESRRKSARLQASQEAEARFLGSHTSAVQPIQETAAQAAGGLLSMAPSSAVQRRPSVGYFGSSSRVSRPPGADRRARQAPRASAAHLLGA
eukprot:TRINITY_DN519_c0_g1_i1.p1 TRINITY_DN519_c0_g1~~TRINITY_DN519_c0_g1_i1.p1  ORF type:complete len:975 (+),score=274.51 TRINITY_DN519_c0_g1_i1:52-2976(+)